MKNNKSSIYIFLVQIIFLLSIFIIIPLGLYLAGRYYSTDKTIYEQNWDIVLPNDLKENYSVASPPSFHGDGERYTIFTTKEANKIFMKGFSSKKDSDIEDYVKTIINDLGIENKNQPDFSQKYVWKRYDKIENNVLVILYLEDTKKFYFVQFIF